MVLFRILSNDECVFCQTYQRYNDGVFMNPEFQESSQKMDCFVKHISRQLDHVFKENVKDNKNNISTHVRLIFVGFLNKYELKISSLMAENLIICIGLQEILFWTLMALILFGH